MALINFLPLFWLFAQTRMNVCKTRTRLNVEIDVLLHKHHAHTLPSTMHITLMWIADNSNNKCEMEWNMLFVKTSWVNNLSVFSTRPFERLEVEGWTLRNRLQRNKHDIKTDISNLWCQCRFWALHLGKWIMFCHAISCGQSFLKPGPVATGPLPSHRWITWDCPSLNSFPWRQQLLQRCFMSIMEDVLRIINTYHLHYWDTGWTFCKTVFSGQ